MSDEIIVALIVAGASVLASVLTLVGVIITCRKSNDKMMAKFETHQAVTDEKISELTREVRKHNNFAERFPVVENEIRHMEDDIKILQGFHRKG